QDVPRRQSPAAPPPSGAASRVRRRDRRAHRVGGIQGGPGDMRVLLLNGPNLGSLGRREPEVYGSRTLADLEAIVTKRARELGLEVSCRQSNHEGQLIDWIETESSDAIIINPGALSHSSLALADALRGSGKPVV